MGNSSNYQILDMITQQSFFGYHETMPNACLLTDHLRHNRGVGTVTIFYQVIH